MTDFMISLRSPSDPKRRVDPRYLVIEDGADTAKSIGKNAWANQVMTQFPVSTYQNPDRTVRHGDILFLVHGFNVNAQAALDFHRKCATKLRESGWNGLLISYDWPSDGLVFAYLPDRFDARASASNLITAGIALLEARQARDCTVNVHVMAHSMGGFVVQQAMLHAYQDVPSGWRVGQVMFVSADVDHTVFSASNQTAKAFVDHAGRFTCYSNRWDKALLASNVKRLTLAPRVGRVGLPDDAPRMMVEVNCTELFRSLGPAVTTDLNPGVSHSFYFDQVEFWDDVALTMAGGLDRSRYPKRKPDPDSKVDDRYALVLPPATRAEQQEAMRQASSDQPTN